MIKMRYEERPQSEVKVLGEITSIRKDISTNVGKIIRMDEYAAGKFRVVEFYDKSGNLVMKSELTGTPPQYSYRLETYYNANGEVISTIRYRRIYFLSGQLYSEEIDNG